MCKLCVEGTNHTVAGGNILYQHFMPSEPIGAIQARFAELDSKVSDEFGKLVARNPAGHPNIDFSSERLFSSLAMIGIPAKVALNIVFNIFPYIEDTIVRDGPPFSTAHIRRAVSNAIQTMLGTGLERNQRQELASKYARNYGNPKHINMILLRDGQTQPLDYRYINDAFLPELFNHISGKRVNTAKVISNKNYSHMAGEIIDCVRRLGVYQIRYDTLLALAEDLAIQLPHPWIIYSGNREATIKHDIERSTYHLGVVLDERSNLAEFWRSAEECLDHTCSLLLAHYTCPIGGGTYAPANTLRNLTRLRASGDHQNLALWEYSPISDFDKDLVQIGENIDEFHAKLKGLQRAIANGREDKLEFIRLNLEAFFDVANKVYIEGERSVSAACS